MFHPLRFAMNKYAFVTFLALLISTNCFSQYTSISGYVMDSITRQPVPYASIGVKGGFRGTASNTDGAFDLILDCPDTCSVTIATLGYYSKTLAPAQLNDTIWLKPATKMLKEVVILSEDVNAYKVVKKAIKSIKKNYITDPFVIKGFYRHYCRDSTEYTRLIEAAIDLYQPKGYKRPIYRDTVFKGQLKLVQTRRLFKRRDNGFHPPIAIKSTLSDDLVGANGVGYPFFLETSLAKSLILPSDLLNDGYEFTLNKITYLDGAEVYEIDFNRTQYNDNVAPEPVHKGKIFVSREDFAIIRYEYKFLEKSKILNGYTNVTYKRFQEKYALFRIEKEKNHGGNHFDHKIFQNTEVVIGKSKEQYSRSISRNEVAKAKYEPNFWKNYNVLKRNQLEEAIAKSLSEGSPTSMNNAFAQEQAEELEILQEEKRHRVIYDSLKKNNEGILCTIIWRSSGSNSSKVADDYKKALETIRKLKAAGVQFVFVSLDYSKKIWEEHIVAYGLENEKHLRVGYNVDREVYNLNRLLRLPQYQIHYKSRSLDDQAPPFYSKEFLALLEKYLEKN